MKSLQCSVFSVVTAGALAASALGQATTGKTISQLPAATNVADADLTIIVQGNVAKRATAALIRAGITGGTADWNALSNRPSWITGATWQTNATSPVAALPIWATDTNPLVAADELGLGQYDSPQFSRVYVGGTNASVTSTGWSYEGTNSGGFSIGVVNNGVVDVGFGISTNQLLVFSNSILFRGSQSWGTNEAQIALTRTNLRIPWSGVTNTNAAGWRADLGLGGWVTNTNLTASLISDFSNAVVAVAPATTNASALTTGTLNPALLPTNVVTRATNGVAQASAWTLLTAPTNGIATIQTNQFGVGWDDMGRFAVMTPVGPLVMYATGDPATPTIWWGGRIVSQEFSAITVNGAVYAKNIVGGAAGGSIIDDVMRGSMPTVLRNFMGGDGAAGAAGVPYILTNSSMQPLPGNYVPYGTVITNGSGVLELTGRWWDMNAFLTNLITNGIPTGSAPANAFVVADGASRSTTRTNLPSIALTPGAVLTSNSPSLLLSQTWSNSAVTFSGIDVNITNLASSNQFGTLISLLAEFKTNNTRVASLDVNGTFYANAVGVPGALEMYLPSANRGGIRRFGTLSMWFAPATVAINTTAHTDGLGLGPAAAPDVFLTREAAGSLAIRAAVAATNNIYGTWTNSTNYRRLSIGMSNSGIAFIRPEQAGPATNGTNLIYISGLPTTNTGLPSGVLWVSNGVVAVTP